MCPLRRGLHRNLRIVGVRDCSALISVAVGIRLLLEEILWKTSDE